MSTAFPKQVFPQIRTSSRELQSISDQQSPRQQELMVYFLAGAPPAPASCGAGSLTSVGSTPQISRAYCAMVRSLENFPDAAMFIRHFFAQAMLSCGKTRKNRHNLKHHQLMTKRNILSCHNTLCATQTYTFSSSSVFPAIFFIFFCVPQLYLWGSPLLGEIFAYVTVFFNPTIKVVTYCLRGWCVLGVFLLPAFTRLGHERQDLLSPCDEMHVCTD